MPNEPPPAQAGDENSPSKDTGLISWTQRPWLKTEPLLRTLLVLLIIIASVWLTITLWQIVNFFSSLLLLFFTAWLLAFMLTPVVRWLIRWGWPKMAAIVTAYLLLIAGITGFVFLVLPGLIAQTNSLINNLGGLTNELEKNVNNLLKGWGITNLNLEQAANQLQSYGTEVLKNALGLATGIASFLIQLLLLAIISFSLLAGRNYQEGGPKALRKKPADHANHSLWQRLPERYRRRAEFVRLSFERNFGVFLGGQLMVALVYGVITWIVMWSAGFDYPVTTGCICGALMIIPFFGGPLSLLPPLIVAFSRNDSPIVIVLIILFVIQTALLNVVLPKLVGRSSGIGPVATLFVLLAGAQVGGVFGVLLAVPIAGVARNLLTGLISYLAAREEAPALNVSVTAPPGEKVELDISTLVGAEKTSVKK